MKLWHLLTMLLLGMVGGYLTDTLYEYLKSTGMVPLQAMGIKAWINGAWPPIAALIYVIILGSRTAQVSVSVTESKPEQCSPNEEGTGLKQKMGF